MLWLSWLQPTLVNDMAVYFNDGVQHFQFVPNCSKEQFKRQFKQEFRLLLHWIYHGELQIVSFSCHVAIQFYRKILKLLNWLEINWLEFKLICLIDDCYVEVWITAGSFGVCFGGRQQKNPAGPSVSVVGVDEGVGGSVDGWPESSFPSKIDADHNELPVDVGRVYDDA